MLDSTLTLLWVNLRYRMMEAYLLNKFLDKVMWLNIMLKYSNVLYFITFNKRAPVASPVSTTSITIIIVRQFPWK